MRTFLGFILILLGFNVMSQNANHNLWKQVDSLSEIGQVQSALEIVTRIYDQSRTENSADQFVKASLYRIKLEADYKENSLVEAISRTQSEINTAETPVKEVLYSILAELYWRYYQQNRWQIAGRSITAELPSDDITTWDMQKLVAACSENYLLSLGNVSLLQSTKLSSFDEILLLQKESKQYRPTLFDFLAHRAIEFYAENEAGLTKPANYFSIDDPDYFSDTKKFAALKIPYSDSLSFDFQALTLYQKIIAFHANDADPTALLDTEIARLEFVHQKCTLPEKDKLYMDALQKLENLYLNHPLSTEIYYQIALQLYGNEEHISPLIDDENIDKAVNHDQKWDNKKALEVCEAAIKRFPGSVGAKNCLSLSEQIKQPSLSVTTDYASVPNQPCIALVGFKNVKKAFIRILQTDAENDRKLQELQQEERIREYLKLKPILSWEQLLPDDGDYRNHTAEIKLPALKAGYYVLLTCNEPDFPAGSSVLLINRFWKSSISYISKKSSKGANELYVLDRQEGQPIPAVNVRVFYKEYSPTTRGYITRQGGSYTSDKQGYVNILAESQPERNYQFYLVLKTKKDQLITENYFSNYTYEPGEPQTRVETKFFTDRSIYRPGQTIYFKGIVLEKKGETVKIKPRFTTEINFYDANGQKISTLKLTTNEFGSFSGSFIAPQAALTGQIYIRCETGGIFIRVEEYKRPKFEVTFLPIKGSYKLNETIVVEGKALAYAGSSTDGATIKYRVVRNVRYPYYDWYWHRRPKTAGTEITNGTATTASDGSFKVAFKAIPDLTQNRDNDPYFEYTVYADVTDINGESHSNLVTVSVGYKALMITTDLEDDVNLEKGISFSLKSTNLNGEPQPASGSISISKLAKPTTILFSRKWAKPDTFVMTKQEFEKTFPGEVYDNEDDITTWKRETALFSSSFSTPSDSLVVTNQNWTAGTYLLEIKTKDIYGEEVLYKKYFTTYRPESSVSVTSSPAFFKLLTPSVQPGETAKFLIATPLKNVKVIYEILNRNEVVKRTQIRLNNEQKLLTIPVEESFRGNFGINLVFIKNNRSFQVSKVINVPYENKKLDISFASFRSKLQPGQEEEWQITLHNNKGEQVVAEILAGMYDASLDAFLPHNWSFDIFNTFNSTKPWEASQSFGISTGEQVFYPVTFTEPTMREYDQLNWFGFNYYGRERYPMMLRGAKSGIVAGVQDEMEAMSAGKSEKKADALNPDDESLTEEKNESSLKPPQPPVPLSPELQKLKIRKDFNETAFFYPQLATDEKGEIVIKFKAPEVLTRWKMMGLAYTKELQYGQVEKTLVTQKDLMLFTNTPRFLREGDRLDFSVKISNISNRSLAGNTELHFFDAFTMKPIDSLLGIKTTSIPFEIKNGLSASISWPLVIPESLQAVIYWVTASSGMFSDGEEAAIPVLTNRMLVTESLSLPVKGLQQKTFTFDKLINASKSSSTIKNYRLSLEFTSNPAWYAIQALPYLAENSTECAEQIFSRYYANSLASTIANSDPKIKRIFESWKNLSPDALKSNLEKNEELKSVLLNESPWVREATNETERKQRIGLLFDLNRMTAEKASSLRKLHQMQSSNGGWPWFPGMPESRYITQHIVTGIGHLYFLDVMNLQEDSEITGMVQQAIQFLDETMQSEYEKIKKDDKDFLKNNHLGYAEIQYLYARTYFLADFPLKNELNEMIEYYKNQSEKFWKSNNNYMKGMIALYMNRFKNETTPELIMRSLKETSLHNDEMGMYWRNDNRGWYWYQAPVETQALLIEAFDEVSNDTKAVEELKIWLLKQKQTQDWKTSKATTEAVYALLLRGADLLASEKQAEIALGNEKVNPYQKDGVKPEAGTGYFKISWPAGEIKPDMGKVTVNNPNPTIAWGALYWQYFEQLDKITPAQTPLNLEKKLFREKNTPTGPVIEPITQATTLKIGDKITVRVVLRADRDMEYIHLKDMRASAFEPVNVLSGYRWREGLGYYESTLDASTNFFIYYLPKGTYVFEYNLVATQKGEFSNGITSVQCMYAPEFSAHSEGIRVKVQ